MATTGLKGVWGFEQLDKTDISTWKLGCMLTGTWILFGSIFLPMLKAVNPNPALGSMSPTPLLFVWIFIAGFVVMYLAMARTTEGDLNALASIDAAVDASVAKLNPGRALLTISIIFQLAIQTLVVPVLVALQLDSSVMEAIAAILQGGHQLILSILFLSLGLIMGIGTAIVLSQIISLTHAASHIKIDLLQLGAYSAIADPLVRLLVYLIPVISAFPLLILYVVDPIEVANITLVVLVFLLFVCLVLLAYAYPVWVLRNRIKAAKEHQLNLITRCLQGDKEAIRTINIHSLDAPTTATDFLTQRMFIETLWEWPIASHVQKIALFGLLPPFTWVLASMIENALY